MSNLNQNNDNTNTIPTTAATITPTTHSNYQHFNFEQQQMNYNNQQIPIIQQHHLTAPAGINNQNFLLYQGQYQAHTHHPQHNMQQTQLNFSRPPYCNQTSTTSTINNNISQQAFNVLSASVNPDAAGLQVDDVNLNNSFDSDNDLISANLISA